MKIFLSILLLLCSHCLYAQDTLWVKQKDGKPYIEHTIETGEDIFLLAKKFKVPPAQLADLNNVTYQQGLASGTKFKIPIDNFNYIRQEGIDQSKPLFYALTGADDLRSISHLFKVSQSTIQHWNNMDDPSLSDMQILLTGWISFDKNVKPFDRLGNTKSVTLNNDRAPVPILAKDNTRNATLPDTHSAPPMRNSSYSEPILKDSKEEENGADFKTVYQQQATGLEEKEESGAAVAYQPKEKMKRGIYYAFHNDVAKGSILKIMNPANRRLIYAKVLGPIPELGAYQNAVVVLSSNALMALGAKEKKVFCKIKYY